MNLIVDVGNTWAKLAIFDKGELLDLVRCSYIDALENLEIFKDTYTITNAIVSTVGDFPENAQLFIDAHFNTIHLSAQTKVPFTNLYSTPNTLGVDRIALVSAAAAQFPNKNVLIIDAGSCVTYDYLNSKNEYLGGAISPGISMRFEALHTFTANLPLLTPTLPKSTIGDSTDASIQTGVLLGLCHEIDGFIDHYKENTNDFTIILTGGDAHLLRDSLKNSIFANPNFLLEGLHHILEHNKQ